MTVVGGSSRGIVENAYYQITADLVYDNTDTLHDNSKQAESISFVQKNMCIDLISVTGKKERNDTFLPNQNLLKLQNQNSTQHLCFTITTMKYVVVLL